MKRISARFPFNALFAAVLFFSACASVDTHPSGLDQELIGAIDAAIERAVEEERIVGGVFFIDSRDHRYGRTYGVAATTPFREGVRSDTIYDLASLTKVVATTPAIHLLAERGKIDIDAPLRRYIPEMSDGEVTIRHLLTHTSGLPPSLSLEEPWSGYEEGIRRAASEPLVHRPGLVFRYSDIGFILLAEVVGRVSGMPLDRFVRNEIYAPLGMTDTDFRPDPRLRDRIAPTEQVEEGMLRGVVHDPTSRRMGGVAGHAGLFSTVDDLRRYAEMILGNGMRDGVRIFSPATVERMTSVGSPEGVTPLRSLGWDMETTFSRPRGNFPFGSIGHTGWTGPFIWIDPASDSFYIFMSNRVHPRGRGSVVALQREIGELASRAAGYERGEPRTIHGSVGGSTANGIDVLTDSGYEALDGMRVGLITNNTGRDRWGNATIDLLRGAVNVELVGLFSPEHGIRGDRDEKVGDGRDARSGLPIYSLYGERRAPSAAQLEGLDALVFDIQDIGARFYTYISTMELAMEAAASAGVRFVVLDRVNPITGAKVEGPATLSEESFTAVHPIAVRHGMTVGELARMFNEEKKIGVELEVVPIRSWERSRWFDQTGLPWFPTSPAIPTLDSALLYPGVCLLERTTVSVGRGTPLPFRWVGAPWIDGAQLVRELESARLPGVRFVQRTMTPVSSLHAGEESDGVAIEVTDREALNALELGVLLAATLHRLYPGELGVEKVDDLLRHPPTIRSIQDGESIEAIVRLWDSSRAEFLARRAAYLIYD
ncbi:MAG: exo-beta-N-acetylmuramidase NamZ domain-containing protein [Thermoanaerobaculia bacterium]